MSDKQPSTQHGEQHGYHVEARVKKPHPPRTHGGQVFDGEWRAVRFEASPIGVMTRDRFDHGLAIFNLMRYEAAQALRWWFLASGDVLPYVMETRLVKHKVTYDAKDEEVGPVEEVADSLAFAVAKETPRG